MSRTNDLRKLIREKLRTVDGVKEVYYEIAQSDALYPHVVFEFSNVDLSDLNRQDYMIEVHVWDKGYDASVAERISDEIEDIFNGPNLPQDNILPTFYLEGRMILEDEDKKIRHRVLQFVSQNYERN